MRKSKKPAFQDLREPKGNNSGLGRTKTGVQGFDEIIFGGIPKGNLVVFSGDPGSGKTVFCFSFLYEGVKRYNEPGVYVSLEESSDDLLDNALEFGMDFKPLIDEGKLKIITIELYDFDKLKNSIEDAVQAINAKRVVIDPGVVFRLFFEKELDARKRILSLGKTLKHLGCTSIITNEISLDESHSLFGLEEYVADGVVLLYHTKTQNRFVRSIAILKMRGTKVSEKLHPLQITKTGLKILSKQELFEEVE